MTRQPAARSGEWPPIRIIVGPTASGKERLAAACADLAGGEIVSVDSMKVYRRLDIATAKPSADVLARIRHHCLNLADPWDSFSAADFVSAADRAIEDIRDRGKPVFLSGGTAFYFMALLAGLFEGPGADRELRRRLEARAEAEGSRALHEELAATDPMAAEKIHPSDRRRLVRALEVAILTGTGISSRQTQWAGFHGRGGSGAALPRNPRHSFVMIRLVRSRDDLRERIRRRVERMAENGLREEAAWVFANRDRLSPAPLRAVGYKEFFPFFRGLASWDGALEKLRLATHRLVRGQETWFRKFPALEAPLAPDADMEETAKRLLETAFSRHGEQG